MIKEDNVIRKRKKYFLAVVVSILLAMFFSCNNADDQSPYYPVVLPGDKPHTISVIYSAEGPDVSQVIGWKWTRCTEDDTHFDWAFKNNGTVGVVHCCGYVDGESFSYLLCGNVFVTLGSEMGDDEIQAAVFDITDTDEGVMLALDNGVCFTRGYRDTNSTLQLSNALLGKWRLADGTEYEFTEDAGLTITSPVGVSEQYGYLVRNKGSMLLTLGPLVDGEPAAVQQYRFFYKDDQLTLRPADGKNFTLDR